MRDFHEDSAEPGTVDVDVVVVYLVVPHHQSNQQHPEDLRTHHISEFNKIKAKCMES